MFCFWGKISAWDLTRLGCLASKHECVLSPLASARSLCASYTTLPVCERFTDFGRLFLNEFRGTIAPCSTSWGFFHLSPKESFETRRRNLSNVVSGCFHSFCSGFREVLTGPSPVFKYIHGSYSLAWSKRNPIGHPVSPSLFPPWPPGWFAGSLKLR